MTISSDKVAELRVKHLEIIEGTISRMAGYSASAKGYCLTLLTAVIGFSITLSSPLTIILGAIILVLFCVLDAQYLKLEKQFRLLYEDVRTEDWSTFPTFIVVPSNTHIVSFVGTLFSWSVISFYMPILTVIFVAFGIVEIRHG